MPSLRELKDAIDELITQHRSHLIATQTIGSSFLESIKLIEALSLTYMVYGFKLEESGNYIDAAQAFANAVEATESTNILDQPREVTFTVLALNHNLSFSIAPNEVTTTAEHHLVIGLHHRYGIGCRVNYPAASHHLNKSASQGNSAAKYELALMHQRKFISPSDDSVAQQLLIDASELNDARAQLKLAELYYEKDIDLYYQLMLRAANSGNSFAENKLGIYFKQEKHNWDMAFHWMRKAVVSSRNCIPIHNLESLYEICAAQELDNTPFLPELSNTYRHDLIKLNIKSALFMLERCQRPDNFHSRYNFAISVSTHLLTKNSLLYSLSKENKDDFLSELNDDPFLPKQTKYRLLRELIKISRPNPGPAKHVTFFCEDNSLTVIPQIQDATLDWSKF